MADSSPHLASADCPAWLRDGQLRWAWLSWEPLMMYRLHGGQFETIEAAAHWTGDWFERIHGEAYIKKLGAAGFNCVTTHFHKGFGMAAEAEEMQMTRRLIEICHHHDIRVLTYVQSMSIMCETFLTEVPDAEQWLAVDENNRPHSYAEQYWRLLPCLSHDGYVTYVQKVIDKAITWANADGVWLDNTNFNPCQCESCQQKFRQYLKRRHSDTDQTRFGISSLQDVRVPAVGTLYDPIYQESIRFRCQSLIDFVEKVQRQVRRLNPEAAVAANFGAPCPYNAADVLGVDHSRSMRAADIILAENGNFPELDGDALITQIMAYKAGHAGTTVVVPSHWRLDPGEVAVVKMPQTAEQVKLTLAESAAFGRRCVGATWAARPTESGQSTFFERDDIFDAVQRYQRFLADNESFYLKSVSLANVALYQNFSSLAFAHDQVDGCLAGFQQCLVQNQVPFDVLFEEDLERLVRYRVLVVANMLCMSQQELEQIRAFVASGGGLVATGQTSLYDEDFRQRRNYGLADLFGVDSADGVGSVEVFKNGRVIFLPGTPERVSCNRVNYQTRAPLPNDHADLVEHVRSVCAGGLPIEVRADPHVAVEICGAGDDVVVHLVNYNNTRPDVTATVSFKPELAAQRSAELICVDRDGQRTPLAFETDQYGRRSVNITTLQTYSLIRLGR